MSYLGYWQLFRQLFWVKIWGFSALSKQSTTYTMKNFCRILVFNKYRFGFYYYLCASQRHQSTSGYMKKKFLSALEIKCKDMGLTKPALNELTELGSASLNDDATDDDINAAVDSLVPYAKAMQAEITRKASRKPSTKQSTDDGEGDGEGEQQSGGKSGNEMPDWAKEMQTQIASLVSENASLKAEKAKTERAATIAEKAKSLGIPEYLVKRMTFADDADIDAELTSLKQDLVNNNLMPKGHAHEGGSTEAQDIADAEAWAASLPNRQ